MKTGNDSKVVSALAARKGFGKLLRRVEEEHRSLVIERRGTPKAVLLSIRDYVRLASAEPDVLRMIGEESRRRGTDKLTSRRIDQVISGGAGIQAKARMIALRLVVDSNILVSAALKPEGLQRTVLSRALKTLRPLLTNDPDDNKFVECADAARADYLVTGNQRHFPKFWKRTKVITLREFIEIVAPHLVS